MADIKIGIVEDEAVTSMVIKQSLQKLQYNIATPAFTFNQALKMVDNEKPDLVLIDINLGEKKDGIELAEILKEKHNTPFIFITANSDTATLEKAKKVNPLAFLVKPFTQADLHTSIEIAFNNYTSDKIKQQSKTVLMKVGRSFEKIDTSQILFLENKNHYFNIHFIKEEKKIVRASTIEIMDTLPKKHFIQISRRHIINTMHIEKIDNTAIYIGEKTFNYNASLKENILNLVKENT